MAQITITIPTNQTARVVDALCTKFGYTGFLSDGVTVQTKQDFVKSKFIEWVKTNVADHEGSTAAATAFNTARTDANNISIT